MNPNISDLLTRPRDFFTALRAVQPNTTRYLWVVLLTGTVTALYTVLSQRPVQEAMSGIPGLPGAGFNLVLSVVGAVGGSLIIWLLLWGLSSLGAGREGRAGEVMAAAMLPSLIFTLILLPLAALLPLKIGVPAPSWSGLEGAELAPAIQKYTAQVQNSVRGQPLSVIGNVLTYAALAWQFYLAFVGFGVLTGDRGKALRSTLIPLGVFLLLGGALWLLGRALSGLTGGAA